MLKSDLQNHLQKEALFHFRSGQTLSHCKSSPLADIKFCLPDSLLFPVNFIFLCKHTAFVWLCEHVQTEPNFQIWALMVFFF